MGTSRSFGLSTRHGSGRRRGLAAFAAAGLVIAGLVAASCGSSGSSPWAGPAGATGTGATGPGASGTGPSPAGSTATDTSAGQFAKPSIPAGPTQTPPPIDNLATPAQGKLNLGDPLPVKTVSVGPNGASVTVSAPGEYWDGLKIDVPAGAWPGATLRITAQPVINWSYGGLVTPASPLYTISGAEGMAPEPVTVKVPTEIPNGTFVMGFFYDVFSGSLEGMPLVAEDDTSVTVATRHFSSFFLSLVDRALLPKTIDSGFRPGKDDWQFTNMGSFVEPGGHCTGQTLTEAWYYIERHKKAGASSLYGLFDNNGGEKTPALAEDDSDGYRLASVAHTQYEATHNSIKSWAFKLRGKGFDALQYDAFRYAIAVTGEPELVSLSDAQDGNGHEIVAYRVAPSGIFVADPNYPAAWRMIPFDSGSGKFGTYFSGASASAIADGDGVTYANFVYDAKTALVDWSALAKDWAAFDDGTIGNGVFPALKLEALAGKNPDVWVPLVDGYRTTEKQLTIRLSSTNPLDAVLMTVHRGLSSEVAVPWGDKVTIDLAEGENPLGILEEGARAGWKHWQFVDFVRLTVTLGQATPSPAAGRWVLIATEDATDPPSDNSSKVESSNGRIATTIGGRQGSVSWGPPPASAAPGQSWTTTLTAQGTCPSDDRSFWSEQLFVHTLTSEPGEYLTSEFRVEADCHKASGSMVVSWPFPPGWVYGTVDIYVLGFDSTGGAHWTYHYTWQS